VKTVAGKKEGRTLIKRVCSEQKASPTIRKGNTERIMTSTSGEIEKKKMGKITESTWTVGYLRTL